MAFQCTPDKFVEIVQTFEGLPNKILSSKDELRFGRHGSLSVDLEKCCWFDHETEIGGDAFGFVKNRTGGSDHETYNWLEQNGYKETSKFNNGTAAQGSDPFNKGAGFRITKSWSYVDEDGAELFQTCRMENGEIGEDGKSVKNYFQRHKTDKGYINNVKDIRQVPYRLPQLIEGLSQSKIIFVVEGEKCADGVVSIGGIATTNAMGSKKWPDELTPHFSGADIIILPDNDATGAKHAELVAAKLQGVARRIRILELPGLPIKGDVVDWIEAGGTLEQLYELVETNSRKPDTSSVIHDPSKWPEPSPLPSGLLPVDEFDPLFLPNTIGPWVMDIADRIQCPPDFVGIPAIVALGAVLGRKISIRAQRKTDGMKSQIFGDASVEGQAF